MQKNLIFPLLLCSFCACVDLPPGTVSGAGNAVAPVQSPFKGLDPGYKTEETAHFKVDAYTSEDAALYAQECEQDYTRIMQDLGLYSFVPAEPYNVVIYRDAAEYHSKTGQPDWSGGATYGNALLLYESPTLKPIMAHEMTHLIFNDFMGLSQASQLRWLNEGAAVYEETRADPSDAAQYQARVNTTVAPNPIPFSQMVNLAPQDESQQNVDRWYAQVGSVVAFMIRQGGSFNFSVFLTKLRSGESMDLAISETYGTMWHKLSDVENAWKLEIQS